MKSIITFFSTLFLFTLTQAQPNLNMSLVGSLEYSATLNDIWGYTAPDSTEYALVGLQTGVSIVSLADPANPEELFFISGANSIWRDIKTWDGFAYVTNESSGGLAVIDLRELPDNIDSYNWTPNIPELGTLSACHNIFIDEFGWAYLSGCNLNGGGFLFIDVFTNPGQPEYGGKGPFVYSHDLYARDNKVYSADINAGYFSIHDVTNKSAPVQLGIQNTAAFFTHNTWLSDDGTVLFTTDEVADAPIGAYNVSDPNNIEELDQFRPFFNLDAGPIPHNVFVWDDYLIISYYTEGCIVVDAAQPDNLIQVGNFDTFLTGTGGFSGAWGAYPYLPSQLVLVSDQTNGLFVLEPNYIRACYLEGKVTDASDGSAIVEAKINFVDDLTFANTDISGEYKTGIATAGTYDIRVSKLGYQAVDTTITLENDSLSILNIALQALPAFNISGSVTEMATGTPVPDAKVKVISEEITFETTADASGNFILEDVFAGDYEVVAGKWGFKTTLLESMELNENNNTFNVEVEPGIEDIFLLDLGWQVSGNAPQGHFELAVPPLELSFNGVNIQLGQDSNLDPGNGCYITGNVTDLQSGVLIGGTTRLISPEFDATTMQSPWVSYETYFLNAQTSGPNTGNDALLISISNGDSIITLESIVDNNLFDPQAYSLSEFNLSEYIVPTENMQIIFEINDNDFNDVSEASVDNFKLFDNPIDATTQIDIKGFTLDVFPNPSSNVFQINYTIEDWNGSALLQVYNALGQLVHTQQVQEAKGNLQIGEKFEEGLYFVQFQHGERLSQGIKILKH